MKQIIKSMSLVAALSGLSLTSQAQLVVWSQNFDSLTPGTYGATTDFQNDLTNPANPADNILTPGDGGSGNAMALTFNTVSGTTVNIQTATPTYAAVGNTSASLADYTLSFDMAIQGVDVSTGYGGLQISVQNGGGIFGPSAVSPFVTPACGDGGGGVQTVFV